MDLNQVIANMKSRLNEAEPLILEYWGQRDFATARDAFNGYLKGVNYDYFAPKIEEGFDRGRNVLDSVQVLKEVLGQNHFSSRVVKREIRRLKADLAQTALSDGPVDLTIRL